MSDPTRDAWRNAIDARNDHRDQCWLDDGGCSAPICPGHIVHCPEGQRLADLEQAAYRAWRALHVHGLVVAS